MNNQILLSLKRKLEDLTASGMDDAETLRNAFKEELQYYVLNFIYHHGEYGRWTMYGGSALRVCHGLDRMSVDLDFEVTHPITDEFLKTLQGEVAAYFTKVYGIGVDLLTVKIVTGRGLLLKFHIGDVLGVQHHSKQVHVKIDLNHFIAPKTAVDRRPINRDQLSFVIRTYTMATLMASKIAAIFLRGKRGVGTAEYDEKGRDIYDLLWYMNRKVVPDLTYLRAKGIELDNARMLFDRLTLQLNKVNDTNLAQDLLPLFVNRSYIEHWLQNWRESYLHLLDAYRIRTATSLQHVGVEKDFRTDIYSFEYSFKTLEGSSVRFVYTLSDHWVEFRDGDLHINVDESINNLITFSSEVAGSNPSLQKKLVQYAYLFYGKTESYLMRSHRIVIGDVIATKLIRMTAENLNQREQILLNKSALLSAELDDLLM